jgi:hypothetical protein
MNSIKTIADAFAAVGKMYLNLHILQLLMPPHDNNYDDLLPLLSKFSPYGQDKLNEIINCYYQNPKLKTIFNKEIEPFKHYIIGKIEKYKKISSMKKVYTLYVKYLIMMKLGRYLK